MTVEVVTVVVVVPPELDEKSSSPSEFPALNSDPGTQPLPIATTNAKESTIDHFIISPTDIFIFYRGLRVLESDKNHLLKVRQFPPIYNVKI